MDIERLTNKDYWDDKYHGVKFEPLRVSGSREFYNAQIYESIQLIGLENKRILEIGAGGSQWLPFLAKRHPSCQFAGLDYSQPGCQQLRIRADKEKVDIAVYCADLFNPPDEILESFDAVISFGVVEHFDDLPAVLEAFQQFVKPGGLIYTEIPNMAGIIGPITRWLDRAVYDVHNPHDLLALVKGHQAVGMSITNSAHIASTGFNVLTSCINDQTSGIKRFAYLWMCRLSTAINLFETSLFRLPKSKVFSPLMFCLARKSAP